MSFERTFSDILSFCSWYSFFENSGREFFMKKYLTKIHLKWYNQIRNYKSKRRDKIINDIAKFNIATYRVHKKVRMTLLEFIDEVSKGNIKNGHYLSTNEIINDSRMLVYVHNNDVNFNITNENLKAVFEISKNVDETIDVDRKRDNILVTIRDICDDNIYDDNTFNEIFHDHSVSRILKYYDTNEILAMSEIFLGNDYTVKETKN